MMCIKYYQTFPFFKIEYINEVRVRYLVLEVVRVRYLVLDRLRKSHLDKNKNLNLTSYHKEISHNESLFKETQKYNEFIDAFLKNYKTKIFAYADFKNRQEVDVGGSAIIYSAYFQGWKYALKSLDVNINDINEWDNKKVKGFINELRISCSISHPNIIKLYGVTKDPETGNFNFVMQFANNGNLREYLQRKWSGNVFKILLEDVFQIAKGITLGINYLHENGIIHRDLHSKNILIIDGKPLIADFGISKLKHTGDNYNDDNSRSEGMPAYIDPQWFNPDGKYERDERSDIYSLGVLLWELTSGTPPFSRLTNDYAKYVIAISIYRGEREKMITGTPQGYADIYKNCWSLEPEKRPKLNDILSNLYKLSTNTPVEFIINNRT
ncbi:kinase-like domain-containing protein [Gigaspora rosea]|uniref:Kinase-like domain-containing protein n=1 Tax=Gigaspora rosea TaxID=44941 RepID=A0A397TZW8_9GLOM|nr:kinase-like domain-containing protein [Gigaspora rosea]